jgi:uncharacterized protein YceK
MRIISLISFILLSVIASGCIGFLNGYMADPSPEGEQIRKCWFPAVATDICAIDEQPILSPIFIIDMPISTCVDTLFLPARTIGYFSQTNSVSRQDGSTNDAEPTAAASPSVGPAKVDGP